ncbi:Hypothetical protein NTJ_16039 [Nesidiocoris tenuis]|uniref:Uncharacterized protein n=1 Tax=Nesidiocoris tenuis TaxID=355587 RepID=A0ABN7BFS6_9HEMI|nr:Hypothetical protein NTJ_16039 [Nesidiocoris tenuis]
MRNKVFHIKFPKGSLSRLMIHLFRHIDIICRTTGWAIIIGDIGSRQRTPDENERCACAVRSSNENIRVIIAAVGKCWPSV